MFVYSPGSQPTAAAVAAAGIEAPVATPETPAAPPAVVEKPSTLAETIRAEREARAAKTAYEASQASLEKRAQDAEEKLSKHAKTRDNILLDAAGYMKEMGLEANERALVAEMLMYDLVPEKAPPDLRARMVEAQYARDKKLAETRSEREKAEAKVATVKAQEEAAMRGVQMYQEELVKSVPTLAATDHPVCSKWFGQDHADYAESLFHTAQNMANEAQRAGHQADLSPANVAKVLEAHMATKAKAFAVATPAAAPTQVRGVVPVTPAPEKPKGTVVSKQNSSDADLIARATRAAFGSA
jgi:hypothetical protein